MTVIGYARNGHDSKMKESRYSILVVEDGETQSEQTRLVLESKGHRVLQAANGKEGWETLHAHTFDLVISDIMMPVMDGFSLCEEIKRDQRTSHIPLILLTSFDKPLHVIRGLESGADQFM